MDIVFRAIEDIKKGQEVKLDFATGELSIVNQEEPYLQPPKLMDTSGLQPKEKPNIIERGDHALDDLLI